MGAIALGLSTAIFWGTADFLGGLQSRRLPLTLVTVCSQGTGLVIVIVAIAVVRPSIADWQNIVFATIAGLALGVGILAFYGGLARGTMSVVAPIGATGVAIPVLIGLVTGDHPSSVQTIGVIATATGVISVSRTSVATGALDSRTMVLGVVAAIALGGFLVAMDAAGGDLLWAVLGSRIGSVLVLGIVAIRERPRTNDLTRGSLAAIAGIGVIDLCGTASYALATKAGLLSLVSVLCSLYSVVTIVLARTVLDERLSSTQVLGVGAALTGVGLIAAGA
jgi:uncharacterized membrane protein